MELIFKKNLIAQIIMIARYIYSGRNIYQDICPDTRKIAWDECNVPLEYSAMQGAASRSVFS